MTIHLALGSATSLMAPEQKTKCFGTPSYMKAGQSSNRCPFGQSAAFLRWGGVRRAGNIAESGTCIPELKDSVRRKVTSAVCCVSHRLARGSPAEHTAPLLRPDTFEAACEAWRQQSPAFLGCQVHVQTLHNWGSGLSLQPQQVVFGLTNQHDQVMGHCLIGSWLSAKIAQVMASISLESRLNRKLLMSRFQLC